jgi:DNA-binding Lrp family transcriptional regulator
VSYDALAAKTGFHPKSVKVRLQRLRDGGVIEGPFFEPWPSAFGLYASGFRFDRGTRLDATRLERALAAVPTVQLCVFSRSITYVIFWHEGRDPAPTIAALERAIGVGVPIKSFETADFPSAAPAKLSDLGRRVVVALRRRPARALSALARDLGVTTRTVERRTKSLIERHVGALQIRFRPSRIEGSIYAAFVVDEATRAHPRASQPRSPIA